MLNISKHYLARNGDNLSTVCTQPTPAVTFTDSL